MMADTRDGFLDRLLFRRMQARLAGAAETAPGMAPEMLRSWRNRARAMRKSLDRVIRVADDRLGVTATGPAVLRKPLGTDWSWRPDLWNGPQEKPGYAAALTKTKASADCTLFHDCADSQVTIRQIRNQRDSHGAPFGFQMDIYRFDGSFLSLALDLPEAAVDGLKLRHLIRLDAVIETERPLEIFARLNIKHGPNVEQLLREIPLQSGEVLVEFDLAYAKIDENRVDKAWLDLIFNRPDMNQITVRDVTLSRRPRAEL